MKINVTIQHGTCVVRLDALTMENHEREVWIVFATCVIAADHVIPSSETFGAFPHEPALLFPPAYADAFVAEFRSLTHDWTMPVQITETP
jgi:hypothetical protein